MPAGPGELSVRSRESRGHDLRWCGYREGGTVALAVGAGAVGGTGSVEVGTRPLPPRPWLDSIHFGALPGIDFGLEDKQILRQPGPGVGDGTLVGWIGLGLGSSE